MYGVEEFGHVAAGEIGSADRSGEEGVSGEQERMVGEIEADGAFGVAGGVEDDAAEALLLAFRGGSDSDEFAIVEGVVGIGDGGGGDAEPAGLNVHHFNQRQVVLVVEDGGAGELFEAVGSGDVVNVGVGNDDLLDGEVVLNEEGEDAGDVVAGVDDYGFVGGFVAEDGAVALEGAYGQGFEDHDCLRVSQGKGK